MVIVESQVASEFFNKFAQNPFSIYMLADTNLICINA